MKFRDLQGSLTFKKFFMTVFFLENFSSKMMFSNSNKSFQSIRSEKLADISYLTDLKHTGGDKKIPQTFLKTKLNTKETTYTLIS
jgi:hypothetical protein